MEFIKVTDQPIPGMWRLYKIQIRYQSDNGMVSTSYLTAEYLREKWWGEDGDLLDLTNGTVESFRHLSPRERMQFGN